MQTADDKIIHLHARDNVAVCIQSIAAGETILLDGHRIIIRQAIGLGHKLASKHITEGELIIKYGVPIGTATANIAMGEHVHTHNIKSNYIPTEE